MKNCGILLLQIFRHLNLIDLSRCACVCRAWKEITEVPQLWRRVSAVFNHQKLRLNPCSMSVACDSVRSLCFNGSESSKLWESGRSGYYPNPLKLKMWLFFFLQINFSEVHKR